jgi:hypothetical protein
LLIYHPEAGIQVDTCFGPAVRLSIRDSMFSVKKVFLPQRFSAVVMDEDIASINSQNVWLYLVCSGVCTQTKTKKRASLLNRAEC